MSAAEKLTPLMEHMVLLVAVGLTPYGGSFGAERLARGGSVRALVARGLLERTAGGDYLLTELGRDVACTVVRRGKPQ
ncbi:hypothetical protein ABL849_22875 [Variovorax sp. 375MFSha3.1]|uniref:hypothetical protein n=1 Tax=Variovorax sp. 375MFSha3.1 TaxID=3158364 RepID=UPI003AAE1C85